MYDYQELINAYKANRTEENLKALAEWFEAYGTEYWNGEFYNVEELDSRLYPIYEEVAEDEHELKGWELR